jgi:hypothetical protein
VDECTPLDMGGSHKAVATAATAALERLVAALGDPHGNGRPTQLAEETAAATAAAAPAAAAAEATAAAVAAAHTQGEDIH